jgi:hypothetical protein
VPQIQLERCYESTGQDESARRRKHEWSEATNHLIVKLPRYRQTELELAIRLTSPHSLAQAFHPSSLEGETGKRTHGLGLDHSVHYS